MHSNFSEIKKICVTLILSVMLYSAIAQINPAGDNIQTGDVLEQIVESEDASDFDYDTFLEYLDFLKRNPINLNTASLTDLRTTRLFTEAQVRDLLQHIKYYGPLLNIYELQTISTFSMQDIYRILPYITIEKGNTAKIENLLSEFSGGKYQVYFRTSTIVQQQRGYSGDSTLSSPYLGDNYRMYTRFRYAYKNKLSYGITAEKDPGESFGDTYQPNGYDFYSAHFFMRSNGFLKALALGDYEVRIGQGLTILNGFGLGKSVYSLAVRRSGPVLDPYTSVDENRFLRGAAATIGSDNLQLTLFGSYKKIDANVSAVDSANFEEPAEISSINYTGLHRTLNELSDKDAIDETIAGADLTYYNPLFTFGVSGNYSKFSVPLQKDISPYEIFDFNSDALLNVAAHYSVLLRNNLFFGETAMSDNKKIATINGLIISVDPKVDLSLVYRYYDRAYQSIYANAFAENSTPQNEQGMYAGFEIRPKRAFKLSGYLDMYKNPWLEFDADAPAVGSDILGQITYQPNKILQMYLRFKTEVTSLNADSEFQGDVPHDIMTDVVKQNIRWHIDYKVHQSLTLRSRFEYVRYDQSFNVPENGFIIYQDVNYKPLGSAFAFYTRLAVFNTASYDTRLYTYESDLLYAYSITNFSDKGTRTYAMVQYSPLRWIDFWFKIANTHYTNRTEIGSGNDLITGSNKTELRFQVRITW